ncbi:efflux protein [Cryptococcus gattii Ru294]|uniref:Efflux protein, putative n=2 Tax=Cryptococcus gattii TaxID=37769 RepID=E6R0Z3_CRYGW|nr:Efflux protein, putative [Cryptococcus gattii WM276]ADV20469.1 Efflux protein, putative [Cryptococcus gattii WM276]KIR53219.1 efflux protein [Cryptococcus gattii Ru294]KIR76983.1 efflux protein [Cryptococcus gattii EJB2]KIY31588.1 efflux protein [Cryptococcus gattii E566]
MSGIMAPFQHPLSTESLAPKADLLAASSGQVSLPPDPSPMTLCESRLATGSGEIKLERTSTRGTNINSSVSNESRKERDIYEEHPVESLDHLPSKVATIKHTIPPRLTTPRLITISAILTFTMCMSAAGQQALNIALPTIQTDLGMSESNLQWITSAYTLTNGCFLLLSGRLADIHGRKKVYLAGVTWYAIWTLIGGFMKNGAALVVTRALAGSGASMSTPSAVGIIAHTFSGRARSTAFASFSAGAPVGGALGLILGGLFTSYVSNTWRGALYCIAGLAFAVSICAFFVVPNDGSHSSDRRVDWIGAALVTVGLIFLLFSISDGENAPNGWKTSYVLALLIIGFFLVVAFFFWERHIINNTTRPPLMRLQLWTRAKGRLASVYFIGFVAWMGFTSLFYHTTLYYQQVQGTGAVGAMLRFLPTSISGILCNVLVAFLVSKVKTQYLVCTGLLATGIANLLMALSQKDTLYWRLPFNAMWLSVMGADFLMATSLIFVAALALPDEQSVAGALFQTLIQLGGSFGLAVTSVISDVQNQKALRAGKDEIEALLTGLHAAFWLGAAMSFIALIIALIALKGMGTVGKGAKGGGLTDNKHKKEEKETGEEGVKAKEAVQRRGTNDDDIV